MLRPSTAMVLLLACLCLDNAALGEAPTSQFGFQGWPYRQHACTQWAPPATATPVPTPTQAPPAATLELETGSEQPSSTPLATQAATKQPSAPTSAPASPTSGSSVGAGSVSALEQQAWALLNADRAAYGLEALTLDPALSAIARAKCEDMRDQGYFAHTSPTYGTVAEMLAHFGYSAASAGENIAHHATVEKAQAAFLSSDGHRRNMLSAAWSRVGVGVCYDAMGYVYVTQLFVR